MASFTSDQSNILFFDIKSKYNILKNKFDYYKANIGICKENNQKVTIKKISKTNFENSNYIKRVLREIFLLNRFNNENIVKILDLIPSKSTSSSSSSHENLFNLYVVKDFVASNLSKVIQSDQNLTYLHVQYLIYQIMSASYYLHSNHFIHCNIKPLNILVNSNCEIKLANFEYCIHIDEKYHKDYDINRNLVTLISDINIDYLSPEIILDCKNYSYSVDIWSIGCIFVELVSKETIFPCYDKYYDGNIITSHINNIINVLGPILVPQSIDNDITNWSLDFITNTPAKSFVSSIILNKINTDNSASNDTIFYKRFPEDFQSTVCLHFLFQLLKFNPNQRLSSKDALKHNFFKELFDSCALNTNLENESLDINTEESSIECVASVNESASSVRIFVEGKVDAANLMSHNINFPTELNQFHILDADSIIRVLTPEIHQFHPFIPSNIANIVADSATIDETDTIDFGFDDETFDISLTLKNLIEKVIINEFESTG